MLSPFELGSVRTGTKNQLVTINDKEGTAGVEIRDAHLKLTAESRLEKKGLEIPATGWDENFKTIRGSFNIPPGWRTLALFGVDYSKGTWFSKWSLLSLFFVLVLSIGMFKLKGLKWSVITFFSLVLLIHEKNAPYWIWLHLLISLGLERAMAQREKINNFVRIYRLFCLLILVTISFPFVVEQVQKAIYPSLERQVSNSSFYSSIGKSNSIARSYAPKVMKKKTRRVKNEIAVQSKGLADSESFGGSSFEEDLQEPVLARQNQMEFDPNSLIQTGPGIPSWSWGHVSYGWEGPVKKGHSIYLVTLSPSMNRFFTFLRILLLCLLLYCFIDLKGLKESGLIDKATKGFLSIVLLGVLSLNSSDSAYAQSFPQPEILKELKQETLKPADCFPNCISIEKMDLRYTTQKLMIKLKAHVAKASFFTLPGSRDQWFPQSVIVNGKMSNSLKREGQGLSLYLSKGIHDVVLTSELGANSQVQVALGLKPKNISHSGVGWSIEGIRENGTFENSLTFYRKKSKKSKGAIDLGSTLLPYFVKVERVFNMGLNWSVRTTISRLSPTGRAINLEIQKVQGEKLTSSNVEDQGSSYKVNLSKSARSISWNSILPEVESFNLRASSQNMISEVWRFQPGPIWRVEFNGLPKVSQLERGAYAPLYRPWPGEEVALKVTRPKSAPGKAITLEQANLMITPGKRLTSYDLRMTFKTSMGVAHNIKLPEGSKLSGISINGKSQSITLKENTLRLPLGVGSQKVQLKWVANEGISSLFKTPQLDLGLKGINLKLQVKLSAKRWVIYLGGPVMGPAVLFWGKLIALFIFSFFLSRIPWCPLSFLHWCILSIGLTQGFNAGIFLVVGFIIFISFRRENFLKMNKAIYNVTSILSILGAILCTSTFIAILKNGLLGGPKMGIEGNESNAFVLNWFVDRFDGTVPYAWLFSFPTIAYQLLMLAWAIWMTFSLIKWIPWLWEGIYGIGFFRKIDFNMKNNSQKKEIVEDENKNK